MVIIDTNIVIDHLRNPHHTSSLMMLVKQLPKEQISLSIISIQELYEGRSTLDSHKEEILLAVISPLTILPYTFEIAQLAGQIARDLIRPIEFADAAIAATAIINEADLLTLNTKDFMHIKDLQLKR